MPEFRISGIWKNANNVITHYAFHTFSNNMDNRAVKTSKAEAIKLVESNANITYTLVWNYNAGNWDKGEKVLVVNGPSGKYLRSNPDKKITDNLGHLINYVWIAP